MSIFASYYSRKPLYKIKLSGFVFIYSSFITQIVPATTLFYTVLML